MVGAGARLLLAVILPLSAAPPPSPDVAQFVAWPQGTSDIPADPAVKWEVLPNGMRYALMRNRQPLGAVSMRLSIELGSLDESEEERGLAHFIEHMAFNGSSNGYWLGVLAQAQGQPEQTADLNLEAIAKQLRAVTISDLGAVARDWLTDANIRSVKILSPGVGDRP